MKPLHTIELIKAEPVVPPGGLSWKNHPHLDPSQSHPAAKTDKGDYHITQLGNGPSMRHMLTWDGMPVNPPNAVGHPSIDAAKRTAEQHFKSITPEMWQARKAQMTSAGSAALANRNNRVKQAGFKP